MHHPPSAVCAAMDAVDLSLQSCTSLLNRVPPQSPYGLLWVSPYSVDFSRPRAPPPPAVDLPVAVRASMDLPRPLWTYLLMYEHLDLHRPSRTSLVCRGPP